MFYNSNKGEVNTKTNSIYRVTDNPIIWEKKKILEKRYPSPGSSEYFVYNIEPVNESWIEGKE